MPQFEQDSVSSCALSDRLEINPSDYPWLNIDSASIPTFLVGLQDGTQFRFGSLIGLNKTVQKIADSVSMTESSSAQNTLFIGLPSVLAGKPTSGISKVENCSLPNSTLFTASRNLVSATGLLFTIQGSQLEHEQQTVLRVGISSANQRKRLLGFMGIKQVGGKRRQS